MLSNNKLWIREISCGRVMLSLVVSLFRSFKYSSMAMMVLDGIMRVSESQADEVRREYVAVEWQPGQKKAELMMVWLSWPTRQARGSFC